MFFQGDPVKVIGSVDSEDADKFYSKLFEKFNNKWVRRNFSLMDTSYCLKAISPSNFDKLDAETETDLKNMLMPWVEPYVSSNDVIVYLDVSSLPPGAQSKAHVDYTWFHLMSKRIRIPLITNPKSTFSLLTDNGSIKTYNLKVGKVYETNNSVIHMAANLGDTPRWHIVADILDKRIYEYLLENNKLSSWGLHPSINFCLNPEIATRLEEALKSDPINI